MAQILMITVVVAAAAVVGAVAGQPAIRYALRYYRIPTPDQMLCLPKLAALCS
jgi:hypothetical protein